MTNPRVLSRNTDSKGRLTLGESLANRTMLIEREGDRIIITPARVIPEREAWLYENKRAVTSVRRGLRQARARKFAGEAPDLTAAEKLAADLEEG